MADRTATRRFEAGHVSAQGHFPGNPIIPGAVLLREIVSAITAPEGKTGGLACREIRSAKFHFPVRPGDTLVISWSDEGDGVVRFSCSIAPPAGAGARDGRTGDDRGVDDRGAAGRGSNDGGLGHRGDDGGGGVNRGGDDGGCVNLAGAGRAGNAVTGTLCLSSS